MKVLLQEIKGPVKNIETLNAITLSEGELTLRKHEVDLLTEALRRGGKLMPEGSRKFQDWQVGLLERFTYQDVEPL